MAIYLKPRRGSKQAAFTQNIGLKKGEIFLEFPTGYVGGEPGRIVIGDGATSYERIDYATTSTNVFQPFITDPSIYVPRFKDSAPSAEASAQYNWTTMTNNINSIGDGSAASTTTLPVAIGHIKESLSSIVDAVAWIKDKYLPKTGGEMSGQLRVNASCGAVWTDGQHVTVQGISRTSGNVVGIKTDPKELVFHDYGYTEADGVVGKVVYDEGNYDSPIFDVYSKFGWGNTGKSSLQDALNEVYYGRIVDIYYLYYSVNGYRYRWTGSEFVQKGRTDGEHGGAIVFILTTGNGSTYEKEVQIPMGLGTSTVGAIYGLNTPS